MSHITTYTGNHFDPINPDPELINIVDIAHALPMICRGNGQVSTFWSVGEHCILCAKIKEIDDAVLWYDMKYLLGEDSEGDKPETCMVPDYTVRAFKDVEQEYLEIFEKYKVL